MSKIKDIYQKHKEIILYIFFGVLTTLVDFIAFWVLDRIFDGRLYLVSNLAAWALAAVFAYFVNKLFVFESRSWKASVVVRELLEFFGARIFSLIVSELGMLLLIDVLSLGEISFTLWGITITGNLIAKGVLSVIVIILNYFFSKFIIFKRNKKQDS